MRARRAASIVVALGLVLSTAGCAGRDEQDPGGRDVAVAASSPLVVDGAAPATRYDGPLYLPASLGQVAAATENGQQLGAAARAVQCDGPGMTASTAPVGQDLLPGLLDGRDSPQAALAEYTEQDGYDLSGFRVEARDSSRVLYSLDVAGRTKVAVVVVNDTDPRSHPDGWVAESQARCDAAELPARQGEDGAGELTDDGPVAPDGSQVWTDQAGRPVSTELVAGYRGAEHCGWQEIRFLTLGDEQFVADAGGALSGSLVGPAYDPDVPALPAAARDTGYRRAGIELHRTADAVFLVAQQRTERWPLAEQPILCA